MEHILGETVKPGGLRLPIIMMTRVAEMKTKASVVGSKLEVMVEVTDKLHADPVALLNIPAVATDVTELEIEFDVVSQIRAKIVDITNKSMQVDPLTPID